MGRMAQSTSKVSLVGGVMEEAQGQKGSLGHTPAFSPHPRLSPIGGHQGLHSEKNYLLGYTAHLGAWPLIEVPHPP